MIMSDRSESDSRKLLRRLRDVLATPAKGQERLDRITHLIANNLQTEVCSIYLFLDPETLELCATEGLKKESVHKTRMKLGEGLVGRVARTGLPVNTADAPAEKGFRYMPETGEEIFSSFLGVPIQRVGEKLGVLVVQSKDARAYSEDEIYAVEVVAMVAGRDDRTGRLYRRRFGHGGAPQATCHAARLVGAGRCGRRPGLAARTPRCHHQPGGR